MRAFLIAAAILSSTLATASVVDVNVNDASFDSDSPSSSNTLLEPVVKKFIGALPQHACQELIALGEAEGFNVDEESIDNDEDNYDVSSQSIEVYERDGGVISPKIWKALSPWIPHLTNLVKESIDKQTDGIYFPNKQPDRTPQLGWVFLRKYSPDTDRKSLKMHVDSNMHTLNIALNDDFEGGGLFYIKPTIEQEESEDDRPDISDEYKNYQWLNGLKRENTTDIVFPALQAGDVLVHNFTVWHAVAPIEVGTRYSFVLFYDMDNPAIQEDFDEDVFSATFYHEMKDVTIDIAFVEVTEDGEGEMMEMLEENVPPFKEIILDTYNEHIFRAFISGTNIAVSEIVMDKDQHMYKIVKTEEEYAKNDEL